MQRFERPTATHVRWADTFHQRRLSARVCFWISEAGIFVPFTSRGRVTILGVVRLVAIAILLAACDGSTSRLPNEMEQRFQSEGIARRAADLTFRYTRDPGGRSERWENRRASIIVTRSSLLIHKNDKVGIEIGPRTRREVSVQ